MKVLALAAVTALLGALSAGCGSVGEQLSLRLSVDRQICETERARSVSGGESYRDEDGNWVERTTIFGWTGISTVRVQWQASGGQQPYSLVIDSIPPYKGRTSSGSSGARMIGCADNSVGIAHEYDLLRIEEPLYRADPQVDSGWKTIRAVVTDANGQTAEATTRVYVILNTGDWRHVFRGGETHRVFGRLMTVPDRVNFRIGEYSSESRGPDTQSFWIEGTEATIFLNADTYEEVGRWLPEEGAQGAAEGVDLGAKLDELADSIGRLPDLRGQ
ncbi:MAG: hypothetical protein OXD50_16335 [Chloroflexi bacterium]|nr:hypothetical protein [Chloroflexota bacterium]